MFFFIFSVYCLADSPKSTLLVHSPKTPSGLKSNLNYTSSLFLTSSSDIFDFSSIDFPSFILDISLDSSLFPILDSISNYFKIPYLTLTKTPDFQYSSNRFFIFPPTSLETATLIDMIKFFEWKKFSVLLSNLEENLNILKILTDSFTDSQMRKFIYDKNITEELLDVMIKRHIKAEGVKNLVVLDQGSSLELCVRLLKLRKLDQYGNYFLFGFGNYYTGIEGSVELSYEVGKDSESLQQFYITIINHVINKLNSFTLNDFNQVCIQSLCLNDFFILNVKNGKKQEVGTIKKFIHVTDTIIFPGNNTNKITENFKKKLNIMITNGTSESNNISIAKTSQIYKGAHYAAELENSDPDLGDFEYLFIPTDCGNIYFDLPWCTSCLSKYSKDHGLAYITGFWVQSSMANYLSLKSLNISIPQISGFAYSNEMNNKTAYPLYLKMTGGLGQSYINSLILYKVLNWSSVIVISGNSTFDRLAVDTLVEFYKKLGMNIINPPEYRYFPENYTRDDFSKYKYIFEYIRDTKCRVIILFISSPEHILEGFYDVGLRKGDLVVSFSIRSYYGSNDEKDQNFRKKQLEILEGALVAISDEFISDYGKKIGKELKKRYSRITNMCINFDSFLTISNSIKYLIKKGEDFEDPHQLIEAMRNQRFTGCSGDIFFEYNTNSRATQRACYGQVLINSTTNELDFHAFLSVSKFSVLAVQQINKPTWPSGEMTTPTNFRITPYCVYSKHKQSSKYGLIQLHIVSIILFIITGISAFCSQKFFNDPFPELVDQTHPSYQDMIYQFFFIFEFFQILALDHQNGVINKLSRGYVYFAGLDLGSFYIIENKSFWDFEIWLVTLALLYSCLVTLSIIIMKETKIRLRHLELLIENTLPFIGHFSYMPIILMLMNIYKCEEGLSDSLTDSFVSRDCSQFCYKEKHLTYVIVSSISLILFLIISSFFRPFWQKIQVGLRLRTSSSYLSILSIFQLLLVLFKVNFEPYSKALSGFLIVLVLLCLSFITLKTKPFNYGKIIWYQISILLMSSWMILISTIFYMISAMDYAVFALVGGLCIISVVGLVKSSQSYEIFIPDKPNMIPDLIKFQFNLDINSKRPEYIYREAFESELELRGNNPSQID